MNRLRLADVRTPLARVLNECTTSDRVVEIANEAHRRLVGKGKWVGTVQRYRICTSAEGCLVWPRQIETIEGWQLCDTPGTLRNSWYEFSPSGPGLLTSENNWSSMMIDRGTVCTFDDINGTDKKIKVQADLNESSGLRILLRGYDENANWIRTQSAGTWIDGEYVTISNTAQFSTNYFTNITEVVKPVTNGPVRLSEYDTTLATVTKALAYYEHDETVPVYRSCIIPGLGNHNGCGDSNSCDSNKLTVIAKLRHIDVSVDNDFFLLGNLAALKLMAMAILKEERNLFEESMAYEAKAVKELQDELNSYEGDAAIPILKYESPQTWGAAVLNPITLGNRSIY